MEIVMEHTSNLPKFEFIKANAERLADSTGDNKDNQDRIKFVKNDPENRYAIAYKNISDAPPKGIYHISNSIKARFWAPLKVKGANGDETWVIVNKASLHKRFGIPYDKIDRAVDKGNLHDLVENEAYKISTTLKNEGNKDVLNRRGKFVKEGAEGVLKWDWLGGMVKNRYKFVAIDPDNKYAVHYKAVAKQPEGNSIPKLSNFEKKFWTPYKIDNGDSTSTWILLNKSSLCKRFGMDRKTLDSYDSTSNGDKLDVARADEFAIALKNLQTDKSNAQAKELELYTKYSALIISSTESFCKELKAVYDAFGKSDKTDTQTKELAEEIVIIWARFMKEITPPTESILDSNIHDFEKTATKVLSEGGTKFEGRHALHGLLDNLNKPDSDNKMNQVLTVFDRMTKELSAPVRRLEKERSGVEKEKYTELSKDISKSIESFRGHMTNRIAFFNHISPQSSEAMINGIATEFEKLQKNMKKPFDEMQKIPLIEFKKASSIALGIDRDLANMIEDMKNLQKAGHKAELSQLDRIEISRRMNEVLKKVDDMTRELNRPLAEW